MCTGDDKFRMNPALNQTTYAYPPILQYLLLFFDEHTYAKTAVLQLRLYVVQFGSLSFLCMNSSASPRIFRKVPDKQANIGIMVSRNNAPWTWIGVY